MRTYNSHFTEPCNVNLDSLDRYENEIWMELRYTHDHVMKK